MAGPLERLRELWYGSGVYRATIAGRAPDSLAVRLEPTWPGDPAAANALFQGRPILAGAGAAGRAPWESVGDPIALAEIHGFAWLRHLAAADGLAARQLTRDLLSRWLAEHDEFEPLVWRPDVLGRRVLSWIAHAPTVLADAPPAFAARFHDSLARQTRHLSRVASRAAEGSPRLVAAAAAAAGALAIGGGERALAKAVKLVEREIERQILADGGHVERSPAIQLELLRDLAALRRALIQADRDVPLALGNAIDRMAPMLRLFRHADGALAVFQGGGEESREAVDVALARAEARGRAPEEAPFSGYVRLAAGPTVVLIDVGAPAQGVFGRAGHASTLAFELSSGRDRLVVNCGTSKLLPADYRLALRTTAAHSTLTVGDLCSTPLHADGRVGNRPTVVKERQQVDGATWFDAQQDGFVATLGLEHRRRLFLSSDGLDLRGEDTIAARPGSGKEKAPGQPFALRFHLHPKARALLAEDGAHAVLRLEGGEGWIFEASGGRVGLEESVYFGTGERRRCEQLVVSGEIAELPLTLKWRFARATAAEAASST